MPLIKQNLETQLLKLITDLSKKKENQEQSNQEYARELATIIDTYIKTATVTVQVATTGTAAAQTGAGSGSLS